MPMFGSRRNAEGAMFGPTMAEAVNWVRDRFGRRGCPSLNGTPLDESEGLVQPIAWLPYESDSRGDG